MESLRRKERSTDGHLVQSTFTTMGERPAVRITFVTPMTFGAVRNGTPHYLAGMPISSKLIRIECTLESSGHDIRAFSDVYSCFHELVITSSDKLIHRGHSHKQTTIAIVVRMMMETYRKENR